MSAYLWRLLFLSLAALCLVQSGVGLLVRLAAPRVIQIAGQFEPARAAKLMLMLRWVPAMSGLLFTCGMCVPSYLRLEPLASDEELGFACVLLASFTVLAYLIPFTKVAWVVAQSEVRLRRLVRDAEDHAGLYVIRETNPAMALAGLFRSRVVVSREVMGLLSADQMNAARLHERAHMDSGDNWKRVLLEVAPFDFGGNDVRAAWSRFTEWAADDKATSGDSARSVALASALVSVARLMSPGCLTRSSLLISGLVVTDGRELRARVERLLEPGGRVAQTFPLSLVSATLAVASFIAIVAAQNPACIAMVHQLLETLND